MKPLKLLIRAASVFAWGLLMLWCFGILWFLRPGLVGPCLALLWSSVLLFSLRQSKPAVADTQPQGKMKWQPNRRLVTTLVGCLGPFVVSLAQWPSNDRNWAADHESHPVISIEGDDVTIKRFRNSTHSRTEENDRRYETDVTYETCKFHLSQLDQVYFVVDPMDVHETVAHNFLTFRYTTDHGPEYFSVSVEARREREEKFSAVRGLFHQYELIYVIADESDEIGKRAAFRPTDRVYLYPVNGSPDKVQTLFRNIAKRIDGLRESPEFYHSLLNNCTNNIAWHADDILKRKVDWLDSRVVVPGFADRYAYELGMIGRDGEDFESLKARCRIDQIARKKGIGETFSADIRRNTD